MSETKTRKVHTPEYKSKVALQALRSGKTINQIGQESDVRQLLANWAGVDLTRINGHRRDGGDEDTDGNWPRLESLIPWSSTLLMAGVESGNQDQWGQGTVKQDQALGQSRARKFRIQQLSDRLTGF